MQTHHGVWHGAAEHAAVVLAVDQQKGYNQRDGGGCKGPSVGTHSVLGRSIVQRLSRGGPAIIGPGTQAHALHRLAMLGLPSLHRRMMQVAGVPKMSFVSWCDFMQSLPAT